MEFLCHETKYFDLFSIQRAETEHYFLSVSELKPENTRRQDIGPAGFILERIRFLS